MVPLFNSYSILYILFTWFLGICYGFVLLSSAAGQNGDIKLFETGQALTYSFHSSVLLDEKNSSSKNVGFYVTGDVIIKSVWGTDNERLLQVELKFPQLHIKSRKAPSPDGFIPHSSRLESMSNKPFLIAWNNGKIEKILLPKGEMIALINLKKGIASLFQFQTLNGQFTETDTSGQCTVTYMSLSPTKILKTKHACLSQDFPYIKNRDGILSAKVHSLRETEYEFDTTYIKSVKVRETHEIYLAAKEEIGNYLEATQILEFVKSEPSQVLTGENIDIIIEGISQSNSITYTHESLLTEREPIAPEDINSFSKQVHNLRNHLKSQNLGTLKSAKAFSLLVETGRAATREQLLKVLESNKNEEILPQLYDILGYIQTKESHDAAIKLLHFDNENQVDLSERYLWALSFCSQPNPDVIKDLIKKYTKLVSIPDKVKETLILTIASMTRKIHKTAHLKFGTVKAKITKNKPVTNNQNNEITVLAYFEGHPRALIYNAVSDTQVFWELGGSSLYDPNRKNILPCGPCAK